MTRHLARVAVLLTIGAAIAASSAFGQDPVATDPVAPDPVAPAETTPAATAPAPTRPAVTGIDVGIADQKADMFSDQRFTDLGIDRARFAVGWDALSSSWQTAELDAWLAGAQADGVEPLISFGHSRTNRRARPTPAQFLSQFRRFRQRYPWVTTFATWNEANLCGEPTCHRPALAAGYYRGLRRTCPSCTILAPELLDMPNMVQWAKDFRTALGYSPKLWGVHNYVEANRFKQQRLRQFERSQPGSAIWLTETGGLVRRDNASTTDIPEGPRHAGEVTRYIFDRILPSNPQIKRVYLYHWNAGPTDVTWDSGLINPSGGERAALFVLARVLRFGLRPLAPFRSAG